EWHRPRIVEVFYPLKISSTQDRHNWIKAMMLDARLGDRDKTVLTRLALHLNLKTGRCDPTVDLVALETSMPGSEETAGRMVRRSLERADKLGWIERTGVASAPVAEEKRASEKEPLTRPAPYRKSTSLGEAIRRLDSLKGRE